MMLGNHFIVCSCYFLFKQYMYIVLYIHTRTYQIYLL